MKNFPGRGGLWLLLIASRACAPQPGPASPAAGPAGEWIDLAKSTSTDTMVWVLAPGGSDGLLHITIAPGPDGGSRRMERRHGYGRWSVATNRAGDLALCFNKRPGRQPPSCSAFRIDTLSADSGRLRRLTVKGYQGRHHTGDRVLLERRP